MYKLLVLVVRLAMMIPTATSLVVVNAFGLTHNCYNNCMPTPTMYGSPKSFRLERTYLENAPYQTNDSLLWNAVFVNNRHAATTNGTETMRGLHVWKQSLLQGCLPTFQDNNWPREPLFGTLQAKMTELALPRFVLRHPETITAVLHSLITWASEYDIQLLEQHQQEREDHKRLEREDEDEDEDDFFYDQLQNLYADNDDDSEATTNHDEDLDDAAMIPDATQLQQQQMLLAEQIAGSFHQQWAGLVTGVSILDKLLGTTTSNSLIQAAGLQDGIWEHSGWKQIPQLQQQIARMPQLKALVNQLGRRPTVTNNTSNKLEKFAPRRLHPTGGRGALLDINSRDTVHGITLSSSLSQMIPSEAVLLRLPAFRTLFLAKFAESKLLSYQYSGWADVPSISLTNQPRHRMPSSRAGPIVVCLDTSWSMTGTREQWSKAVTLACVAAAHQQGRECLVVAFSTASNIIESGVITAKDTQGITRLLEFLSHSFGGGTDVTGALKHAMTSLDTEALSAADILLVTDGEIPDPPLSDEMMRHIDDLKRTTGMQLHGLLVGQRESKPLSKLCTETHTFLMNQHEDMLLATRGIQSTTFRSNNDRRPVTTSTALRLYHASSTSRRLHGLFSGSWRFSQARRRSSTLYAKRKNQLQRKTWDDLLDDDDDEYYENEKLSLNNGKSKEDLSDGDDVNYQISSHANVNTNAYVSKEYDSLGKIIETIRASVTVNLTQAAWRPEFLDEEKDAKASCWKYRNELQNAIERVGEGLVERQEEAKLVVLAMIATEHILLLGVPGTGKSVLGRRLSKLCNGIFFQRLLTRFTTPDELFGPLSLKSLEHDEYRRVTTGFLPTASVAFLDEIFKANSAILNTLLTILNERKFDNAGGQELCPIRCVVGASNELPESDELDALYDRFLLRKEVLPVSDAGLIELLAMPNPGVGCDDDQDGNEAGCDVIFLDGLDNVIRALSLAAQNVVFGDDACTLIRDLRTFMREELNVHVSDRRLVKASRLLKISAASHGRTRVDQIDCLLLQHLVWRFPDQRSAVRDWLWDNLTPFDNTTLEQFRMVLNELRRAVIQVVRNTAGDISGKSGARQDDLNAIQSLRYEVNQIATVLLERQADLLRHVELLRRSNDHLWLDTNEATAAKQLLLPRAQEVLKGMTQALVDADALAGCISPELNNVLSNEERLIVIETLWEGIGPERGFSDDEMSIGMKEAKAKYDPETFRRWKRFRKRIQN
jgi:MoxR-like ATPase